MDHQDVHREADELRRQLREAIECPLGVAHLQADILALDIAELAEPLPEFVKAPLEGDIRLTAVAQETHQRDRRVRLRGRHQRHAEDAQGQGDDGSDGGALHDGVLQHTHA
jgi:hypothetical protein